MQSREVKTDALRFLTCIYATLNYLLLPKGQILKCPAWMHKVQSGNYAFLLMLQWWGRSQGLLPPDGQTSYLRHCRSHFRGSIQGKERKKEKRKREKYKGGGGEVNIEHGSESEVRRYMVQTPGDGEEDWMVTLPL